jgi:hypothetical protein
LLFPARFFLVFLSESKLNNLGAAKKYISGEGNLALLFCIAWNCRGSFEAPGAVVMRKMFFALFTVMLAVAAFAGFQTSAKAGPVPAAPQASQESILQRADWDDWHNRWRSHRRRGSSGDWHSRWRSHHRWGSSRDWHNRWRSHRRWGSRRYYD